MKEKVTYGDLMGLLNGIQMMEYKAYEEIDDIKPTLMMKLIKARKVAINSLQGFEEKRRDLMIELGKKKKGTEDLVVKDDLVQMTKRNEERFKERMEKLANVYVEVEFEKFGAQELEDSGLACCPSKNKFIPIILEYLTDGKVEKVEENVEVIEE